MKATIEYEGLTLTVEGEWSEGSRATRDYPGDDAGFETWSICLEGDDRDISGIISTHAEEEILARAADRIEFDLAMKEEA